MSLTAIRNAATVVVDGVSGIDQVVAYPPEQAPNVITAWFGNATFEITKSGSQLWTYLVPLTVVIPRQGVIEAQLAKIEPLLLAVIQAFDANITLGNICNGFNPLGGEQGYVPFPEGAVPGFTVTFRAHEKRNVTLTG